MNNEIRDLSAVDRRINYLRQELYTYDKYLRNPGASNLAEQAVQTINAQDNQDELEQLVYLRGLVEHANRATSIKAWQAVVLAFYCTISILIAGLSFLMVIQH